MNTKDIPTKRNGIYYLPEPYTAVTEILSKSIDKGGLGYWQMQQATRIALEDPSLNEKDVISKVGQISREAASRGSTIHSLTEAMDNEGVKINVSSLPPTIRGYAEAFLKFNRDVKYKLLHNEAIVYNSKYKYAGTIDRIYEIDGKNVLLDIKTSKAYYPTMGMQLSAYKNAEGFYDKVKKEKKPFINIDEIVVLLLGDSGKYALHYVEDSFKEFLYAFEIYKFLKK